MLPQNVPRERIGRGPHVGGPRRQKRRNHTTSNGRLETSVPGERANAQLAPALAHIVERIDAIDVNEARGTGEPKIHCRHETLSAGKDFSFLAVRGEEIEPTVNRSG